MSEKVELTSAYRWQCPFCQSVNYDPSVRAELNMEQRDEITADHLIDSFEYEWFVKPENVLCPTCSREFDTA